MGTGAEIRTVVIDDSMPTRAAITDMLKTMAGCVIVGEGANGLEALRLSQSLHPDLIVMDVHMPLMGGLEALRHLRDEAPDTQVVLVTTTLEPEVRDAALAAGATACLEKGADLWNRLSALFAEDSRHVAIRRTSN